MKTKEKLPLSPRMEKVMKIAQRYARVDEADHVARRHIERALVEDKE
jgi:hypothetical protein